MREATLPKVRPVRVSKQFSPGNSPRKALYIKGVSPKVRVVSVVSTYLL
jgi:hypothetical protein